MSWTNDWNYWGFTRADDLKIMVREWNPISGAQDMDDKREDNSVRRVFGPFFAKSVKDAKQRIRQRIRMGKLR